MPFAPTRSVVALLLAPSAPVDDNKAHKHYANESMHLNSAINRNFFRDIDAHFGENAEGTLQVSYHEFMTVLVTYTQSTWMPETLIKMYLLDNLEKTHELGKVG